MFHLWYRLKFIIITLVYCITYLNVCNANAIAVTDICEFVTDQQIYCNCDNQGVNEARQVTCFIINSDGLTRTASVWDGFKLQRNITSLTFTTRFDKKLSFLPVSPLRNFADSLETLNVNEMNLGVLEPNSISNFTKLFKINVESNEIRGLSEFAFAHLPALKSLSLASNSIEVLKANVLIDLPKLEELFLDRNHLITIEDNAFIELKHLKEIDLRLNKISQITSETFSGLTNLKRLDLSRNQLKVIPNFAFSGAPLLRELDLSQNEIVTIQENPFHNMSHLMSLQLNENKIQNLLTSTFRGSPNLVLIDFSNNHLETIEHQLIDNLQHLQQEQFVIYLRENRLECDCRLIWLTNMSRTIGQLFKRELKPIKCTVKREFADLAIGEQIKVLRLGQNESILNACQPKPSTERVITPENENEAQDLFPDIVNNNITIIDNNNKIDDGNYEFLAVSTETSHEFSDEENRVVNDLIEPQKPSGSQVKSNKKDDDSGGVFRVKYDTNLVISCLFIVFIFCKDQFI